MEWSRYRCQDDASPRERSANSVPCNSDHSAIPYHLSDMGNFTFSEIFTIVVVILIVFGPNRLPELARKAGALAARARSAMDSLKSELDAEYGEALAPLREARNELRSAGAELKSQVSAIEQEVAAAGQDLKGAAADAVNPVKEALQPTQSSGDASGDPVADESAPNVVEGPSPDTDIGEPASG